MNTFNSQNLQQLSLYCQSHFPKDVHHILRIADEVSQQTFLFDLPWDMERTFIPYTFKDQIDWDYSANGDEEWTFMLARHRYMVCLGQAYSLTKDEKYALAFVRLCSDFIDHAPLTPASPKTTWRTIDSAIRIENWIKASIHMNDSIHFTTEFKDKLFTSLMEHGTYLHHYHDAFRTLSNWGVLQYNGLLLLGLFMPEHPLSESFIQTALTHLATQAKIQVMDDGAHWEQSPMYHNEVLHCYLNVVHMAQVNHLELPAIILEKTKAMCYANLYWAKPNHHQVIQSDSDDTDVRDLITKGAYLFADPVLKFAGYDRLDFEAAWDLGLEAIKTYEELASTASAVTSIALSDSGNYYFRDSWEENANFMHFRCGTLGSGHGHADLLHIDLAAHGEDILIDSGRYTYLDTKERLALKSSSAHNTTTVDNLPFSECTDSWGYGHLAKYVKGDFITKGNYEMVSGSHLGYMTLPTGGIYTTRKVIYIKPDIFVIVDAFYGQGVHTYEEHFHFNNEGTLSVDEAAIYTGQKAHAKLICVSPDVTSEVLASQLSKHYNKMEANQKVKFSRKGDGFTSMLCVISTDSVDTPSDFTASKVPVSFAGKGTLLRDDQVEALHITKGTKEYTVIICHNEVIGGVDLLVANGHQGYGEVMVFDKHGDLTVLSW